MSGKPNLSFEEKIAIRIAVQQLDENVGLDNYSDKAGEVLAALLNRSESLEDKKPPGCWLDGFAHIYLSERLACEMADSVLGDFKVRQHLIMLHKEGGIGLDNYTLPELVELMESWELEPEQ